MPVRSFSLVSASSAASRFTPAVTVRCVPSLSASAAPAQLALNGAGLRWWLLWLRGSGMGRLSALALRWFPPLHFSHGPLLQLRLLSFHIVEMIPLIHCQTGLTFPLTCRCPTETFHVQSEPQTGSGQVERGVRQRSFDGGYCGFFLFLIAPAKFNGPLPSCPRIIHDEPPRAVRLATHEV